MRGEWIYDFPKLKGMRLDTVDCDGVKIPLTRIEDWFVAYLIMEDPKKRVPMIEALLKKRMASPTRSKSKTPMIKSPEKHRMKRL